MVLRSTHIYIHMYSASWGMLIAIRLREYIVTIALFILSTSSKPEPELKYYILLVATKYTPHNTQYYFYVFTLMLRLISPIRTYT